MKIRLNMNKTNKKLLFVSLLIVGIDLLSKLTALNLLPFHNHVNLIGEKITFYLTYNMSSTCEQGVYILKHENNKNLSLLSGSISIIFLIIYLILVNQATIKKRYKWLIGIGIILFSSIITQIIKKQYPDLLISNWVTSMFSKLLGISFYSAMLYIIRDNIIKLFIVIIISSGIGNLISHFYYPYRVVDFININGSYELFKIGVFNFADLAFNLGFCGLVITLIVIAIRKIIYNTTCH